MYLYIIGQVAKLNFNLKIQDLNLTLSDYTTY